MYQTIGFLGVGTMGSAVARAAAKSRMAEVILLSNRTPAKAEMLAAELAEAGATVSSNEEIARTARLIFLGVKPQMMGLVLSPLASILREREDRFVLATMAAGLSCGRIQDFVDLDCPVIRMMPNTPAAIGAGVVQYCGRGVTVEELDDFAALIAPAGLVDSVPESLIDAASAVSGCGPAFAYLFMEALADGGVACGLPRDKAVSYAAQMLEGAARMVLENGKHPGALKDAVCSPGGTTIQGVRILEERGFRAAAMDAVIAAYEKTLKLR
ncbi:MAG: pyrroline-5-carboxylate reductase [Lawsonibacter sp.]|nr:pyrroline-5-carboxylate reductase [Lawsonibacter sp.]